MAAAAAEPREGVQLLPGWGTKTRYPEERSEDFYPAECNEDAVAD